jgi:hypothetical protein
MEKLFFAALSLVLILLVFSCEKNNSLNTNNAMASLSTNDQPTTNQKLITDNRLQTLVTVNNPNTMKTETQPREKTIIDAGKQLVEKTAEKVVEYIAQYGIEATNTEITKSKAGAFKDYFHNTYSYMALLKKKENNLWTIAAHGTKPDVVGVELNFEKWKDLSGWQYMLEAGKRFDTGETNRIWVNNIYWKDPAWADGKPVRFSAYYRLINVGDEQYSFYYNVWLDE